MIQAVSQRLKSIRRSLGRSIGRDISTPVGRGVAQFHFTFRDHAFLRVWWTNLYEIAPGVWRSNQPSPARVKRYARMGIRSIITLRGRSPSSFTALEEEACAAHGIALYKTRLLSRYLVERDELLYLLDLFRTVERPFLMHCKSGADRAGLASALYILSEGSGDIEEAKAQLSLKFLHLKSGSTGVIYQMLLAFEHDNRATGIGIRDWIATRYDPKAIEERYRERGPGKGGDG